VRALLLVALVALIGAGAFYILSGGEQDGSEGSGVTATLKEITSLVTSASADGEQGAGEPSGDAQAGDLDLGRWFGKADQEATPSNKDVYYQYVDDTGTVHFVQSLGDVPARWQSKAGRIEVERAAPVPSTGGARPAATSRTAKRVRPTHRAAPEVVVYTTPWCGWCQKTLQYLDQKGVRYVNKDIEANQWNRDELIEKTGRTSIPVVEIDGEIIRGYNVQRMEQLLSGSG
jgi:glutaredoxin-like YruB-family protein